MSAHLSEVLPAARRGFLIGILTAAAAITAVAPLRAEPIDRRAREAGRRDARMDARHARREARWERRNARRALLHPRRAARWRRHHMRKLARWERRDARRDARVALLTDRSLGRHRRHRARVAGFRSRFFEPRTVEGTPPGWSRGRKVGWRGRGMPPGQWKKRFGRD